MNLEQYALQQAVITGAAANYAARFTQFFVQPVLSLAEWLALLELLFPQMVRFRQDSADLARQFYDSERLLFHPELPRHDRYLEDYQFDWFVENMEPVRTKMMQADSPKSVVADFSLRFVREVENAGRKQIIRAVESDRAVEKKIAGGQVRLRDAFSRAETRPVLKWARVATGRETCAWCLMLVSRGPVYKSARSGGSVLETDSAAVAALRSDADVSEWMDEWHVGCDCKVVPVYDLEDWPGMDAQRRAEQLWIEAYKDAREWRDKYPDRVHLTGKNKGKAITLNEDVVLALRRRIESGDISSQQWAALQAA